MATLACRSCLLALSATGILLAQDPRVLAPALARLRANDPKAAEDIRPGSPVERAALSADLVKAPWVRRIQASEWLLRAYIYRQRSPTPNSVFAGWDDPYLVKAWKLLQSAEADASKELIGSATLATRNTGKAARLPAGGVTATDTELGGAGRDALLMALEWIRIEVAWRMKDPTRMAEALAPFRGRKSLDPREQLHAFMAAAHTGDWPLFKRLGEELEASGQLDQLHALSASDWTLPDYQGLLGMVRQQLPPAGPGKQAEVELRVKSMGLLLKGFRTEDNALAEKLKAQGAWADSGPIDTPMLRVGAVTHWLKPGATPMPLVGAMTAAEIRLEGSADLALQGGTAWRKERYLLKPSAEAPGRWIGTLEVTQQALDGTVPAAQVFTLNFEVRLDLEERPAKSVP